MSPGSFLFAQFVEISMNSFFSMTVNRIRPSSRYSAVVRTNEQSVISGSRVHRGGGGRNALLRTTGFGIEDSRDRLELCGLARKADWMVLVTVDALLLFEPTEALIGCSSSESRISIACYRQNL